MPCRAFSKHWIRLAGYSLKCPGLDYRAYCSQNYWKPKQKLAKANTGLLSMSSLGLSLERAKLSFGIWNTRRDGGQVQLLFNCCNCCECGCIRCPPLVLRLSLTVSALGPLAIMLLLGWWCSFWREPSKCMERFKQKPRNKLQNNCGGEATKRV